MPATRRITPLSNCPTYVILGSGGHTAEMCKINQALLQSEQAKELYQRIYFVVAQTDTTSREKLKQEMEKVDIKVQDNQFVEVPRSREVGQSYVSAVFTTLWALLWSFWLIWRDRPRLVLCNGPGTCVPFCIAAYILRIVRRLAPTTKIIFVESFCRVSTLSLSGRLLLPLADMLVVQWPTLANRYKHKTNIKYFGKIM